MRLAALNLIYTKATKDYILEGKNITGKEINKKVSGLSLMGRLGFPKDIADIVALLTSSKS